jgi:hypothetical protein
VWSVAHDLAESNGSERPALVDRSRSVGSSSTRPSLSSETTEAGVDTLRLLFETRSAGEPLFEVEGVDGWKFGSIPALALTWAEGHPAPGALANGSQIASAAEHIRNVIDERLGVETDRGVARSDQTATIGFEHPSEARAFLAGMASVQLPRTEVTRRGHPVHSISWTHAQGRRKLARCYDKGSEQGGEAFKLGRLEDQRRYPSGHRPPAEVLAEPAYHWGKFRDRFGPVRKAVDGVKAASFPVIAQALADEARYGFRDMREAERLAGALVMLSGGAAESYSRPTFYRRKAELREAGFVVVDDLFESVEVDLGAVVEQALDPAAWRQ